MKEYTFHTFRMGDVEDPELYAAMPIMEWKSTDQGQWVMEHCADPQYTIRPDEYSWGQTVEIHGPLQERDAMLFLLKWGNNKKHN